MSSEEEVITKTTAEGLFGSDIDESDTDNQHEHAAAQSQSEDGNDRLSSPGLRNSMTRESSNNDKGAVDMDSGNRNPQHDRGLFGSDDEDEEDDSGELASDRDDRGKYRARSRSRSLSGTPPSPREGSPFSDQQERVEIRSNIAMPYLPVPKSVDGKFLFSKLPKFLHLEHAPFDPDSYEEVEPNADEDKMEFTRSQVESTIRWRQIVDPDTGIVVKESNARLVKWSDGSFSLLLNGELFDTEINPVTRNNYEYLIAYQTEAKVLEAQLRFTHHMSFKPSTLMGDTHRILAATVAGKHKKEFKTKMYLTREDPEAMKQKAEQAETERLRAQRKLESARRNKGARYSQGLTEASLEAEDRSDDDNYGYSRRHNEQYEDDFVVDDEEDENERDREQRIIKAKRSNMDKYKRKRDVSEEKETQETPDVSDDGYEDEVIVKKSKRRQVLSEEDE